MPKIIFFLISSALIAILPCFASFFFDSPQVHGFISFDVLFFLLPLFSQRSNLLKKLPLLLVPVIYACLSGNDISYVKALFFVFWMFVAILIPLKKKVLYPVCFVYFLLIVVFEADNFFSSTLSMSLSDVWGVASFYWWGILLFFMVPILLSSIALTPLYFIQRKCSFEISYFKGYLFFLVLIICVALQYVFFPGRCFELASAKFIERTLTPGQISQSAVLMKDTKEKFEIWNKEKSKDLIDKEKNILMILVESWGVNHNVQVTETLLDVFKDPNLNVKFRGLYSREPGHTQGAEWEDFETHGGKVVETPLPRKLKNDGYETWYVHGYDGDFYKRSENYKKYGFDSLLFKDDFVKQNLSSCKYGYEGVCDSAMVEWLNAFFYEANHKFVYWTTLDAHPPYEGQRATDDKQCKELNLNDIGCVYFVRQKNTLTQIKNLAKKHPEVRFIIRGDHRPMGSLAESDFVASFYYKWVSMVILN